MSDRSPAPFDAARIGRLRELIEGELESPHSMAGLLDRLAEGGLAPETLVALLKLKEERDRHAFYVTSENLWYRRLGWRLMRPLFALAVLAGVGFALQRAIDPVLGTALFLAGAGALYVSAQVLFHLWSRRDERQVAAFEARYRADLEALSETLGARG